MTKSELCQQLNNELQKAKDAKKEFDQSLEELIDKGVQMDSDNFIKIEKNYLVSLLEDFYVDPFILKQCRFLYKKIDMENSASLDAPVVWGRVMENVDEERRLKQIMGKQIARKEYYFKRVKLDD